MGAGHGWHVLFVSLRSVLFCAVLGTYIHTHTSLECVCVFVVKSDFVVALAGPGYRLLLSICSMIRGSFGGSEACMYDGTTMGTCLVCCVFSLCLFARNLLLVLWVGRGAHIRIMLA